MKTKLISIVAAMTFVAAFGAHAEPRLPEKIQSAIEGWLSARTSEEKTTGIAAYVSFGDTGPTLEAFAGKVGRLPDDAPMSRDTLFQIGSMTKSFTAAIVLKLEAAGKLSIDDTIGRWLPEYPAWKDVTLRRLLNFSSGIPNYAETEALSRIWIEQPDRMLTAQDLVKLAYPSSTNNLPTTIGHHYSNTNYILAGMIAAKAAGKSYRDLVHELVIEPFGLDSTFYEDGRYPASIVARLARGYFENRACTDYQPKDCTVSWFLPFVGRDVRAMNMSWAQSAGGAIANARDIDRWMRAVFAGRVVPQKQQAEWQSLISTKTGQPINDVSEQDPMGFALGLARGIHGPGGPRWFFQGTTLGYRTLYVWHAEEQLMITVQTNSQPPDGTDKLGDAVNAIHDVVKASR